MADTNSTASFSIQRASVADTLFAADTTNNRIKVGNSTGTGTATTLLVLDSATSGTPTGIAGAMYYDSTANTFRCYTTTWVDCDTGGGGSIVRETFYVEYADSTFYGDGSSNNGTLTAGYDSTNRRNYYDWTSSQAGLQDYDIVKYLQIPSDFVTANNTSWYIYGWANSTSSANNEISVRVYEGATQCNTTDNLVADVDISVANTWTEVNLGSMGTCTFNANDTIRIEIKLISRDNNEVRIGEIRYDYDN